MSVSCPRNSSIVCRLTSLSILPCAAAHLRTAFSPCKAGNAIYFGDMTGKRHAGTGLSNSTRGITAGGQDPSNLNTIDYFTIATLGNAVDFGDITYSSSNGVDYLGSAASATRGLLAGGQTPTKKSDINYITIATTGDSIDFGDLKSIGRFSMGLSDVNGGLG